MLKRTIKQKMPLSSITVGDRFRTDLGDIDGLTTNIKEYGLLQPIVVSKAGNLIAGGRRYAACQAAGMLDVPVVLIDTDDELDARELELIENVFRKDMSWDEKAKLEARIHALKKEQDPSWTQRDQATYMDQSLGATNQRLQLAQFLDAMPELGKCETEQEAVKLIRGMQERLVVAKLAEQARANPAHRWAADHYHLGDALLGMRAMQGGVVQFAEVDPPYGVDLHQHKSKLQLGAADPGIAAYHEVEAADYPDFIKAAALEVYRVLGNDSFAVWWHASRWGSEVRSLLESVGFRVQPVPAIWHKVSYNGQSNMPLRYLSAAYEPFWICEKGNPALHRPGRNNVFSYQPPTPTERFHPAERPLDLILDVLDTFSHPGQVVISPFLGSGNTLRAAYRMHRTAFGWDLSQEYKDAFLAKVRADHETQQASEQDDGNRADTKEDAA